jgi:hypothetical protein
VVDRRLPPGQRIRRRGAVCRRAHLDRVARQLRPDDRVWFFTTGSHDAPANFAGRVGAFLAEFSFQLFGYAAYLIPRLS